MPEVVVKIPEDMKFITKVPAIELSLLVGRLLEEKLERVERLEKALRKSRLTEGKAQELGDRISKDLSKKYTEFYG